MRRIGPQLITLVGIGVAITLSGLSGPAHAQQKSTVTETRQFEVVSVDGNKVVVKGQRGAQEITVNDDFRLTVDGKPIGVHDLKPGMKGTATITTTTTTTPVTVTEVKNGEVIQTSGNSIIVRTANGIKMFSEGDIEKRGIKIIKDGQPADFASLHTGDRLTATIVTAGPPKTMTERQVRASLSPAASAAAPSGAAAPSSPSARTNAEAATGTTRETGTAGSSSARKKLPKTASELPLLALLGATSLAIGALLSTRRRWRLNQH